jgi:hypothetical protein
MVVVMKWNFNLFVNNGPPLNVGDTIDTITAYDKVSIPVPAEVLDSKHTPKGVMVQLQPGDVANVALLYIKSDHYPAKGSTETLYYVNGAADVGTTVDKLTDDVKKNMESAHILIGTALVKLLGTDLKTLKFVNTTANEAQIDIVVGRKA